MKRCWVGLFLLSTLFFACSQKKQELRLALAVPLTGPLSSIGQGIRRSVRLAMEEVIESGKLINYQIDIVEFDDRADTDKAMIVANQIVSDQSIFGVIGHYTSETSFPVSKKYAEAGIPMVSPSASTPKLTEQQLSKEWTFPRSIFRLKPTDNIQGSQSAHFFLKTLKKKKVTLIHDQTDYGLTVAREFKKKLEDLGEKLLSFQGIPLETERIKPFLYQIIADQPEAIYYAGHLDDGTVLISFLKELGYEGIFMGTETLYTPKLLKELKEQAEGLMVSSLGTPVHLLPQGDSFIEKYQKRYPNSQIEPYDHYGYEIAKIYFQGLEKVGPSRPMLINFLHETRFDGLFGSLSFDEKGDNLNQSVTIFVVNDGKFIPFEEYESEKI